MSIVPFGKNNTRVVFLQCAPSCEASKIDYLTTPTRGREGFKLVIF